MRNDLHREVYAHEADFIQGRSPGPQPEPSTADAVRGMVDRALQHPLKSTGTDRNDDLAIMERIRHTMHRDEKLGEWFARTLVSKAEILTLTPEEITRRVALADERNLQDPVRHPMFTAKRYMPSKITL